MICRACIDLLCTNLSKDEQLKARKNSEKKQLDKCKQPGISIQAIFFFTKLMQNINLFNFIYTNIQLKKAYVKIKLKIANINLG